MLVKFVLSDAKFWEADFVAKIIIGSDFIKKKN